MFSKRRKLRQKIAGEFGRERSDIQRQRDKRKLDIIKLYHQEMEDGNLPGEVDDITWNDLQMDEVFVRINHTRILHSCEKR